MTMISEYETMRQAEANEHDAHAALTLPDYVTQQCRQGATFDSAMDTYDRALRAERAALRLV